MNPTRRNFLKGALAATGLGIAGPAIYVAARNSGLGSQSAAESPAPASPATASGIGTAAAAAPAASAVPPSASAVVSAPASASPSPSAVAIKPQPRSLVVIQMAGGNDGLATILPYTDPLLKDNRTSLTFTDDQLLKLTGDTAMHPNLKGLHDLYEQGKVAVVQGVGYPDPNRSHFLSMDIWNSGTPGKPSDSGWLGRYLDAAELPTDNPFNAVAIGTGLPPAVKGRKVAVPSLQDTAGFTLRTDPRHPQDHQPLMTAFSQMYQGAAASAPPYFGLVDGTESNAVQAAGDLKDIATSYHPAVSYPQSGLGRSLQSVAQIMTGGFGTKVYYVSTGGFDTHAGEKAAHDRLMSDLSDSMSAFYQDLKAHGLSQNVVMMTWSEFGRRVKENGSGGTDHGTAAPLFVAGDAIHGGLIGTQPSLSKLDANGDLVFGIDFRTVYNTVLTKWLGMDGQDVLGSKFEVLPLFV